MQSFLIILALIWLISFAAVAWIFHNEVGSNRR